MLHAITQKKTSIYQRYLGHRDESEKCVREEDEITSLIMSPLSFLPSRAIGVFWQRLVSYGKEYKLPVGPVMKAKMHFWPKRKSIEPDMLVELDWATGERRRLLIEFKWRAQLSGKDQLYRQWNYFLTETERDNGCHIFIGPELNAAINARSENNIWNGKLLLRSWLQILNVLSELDTDPEGELLIPWAQQVKTFLELLQIKPFFGFDRLEHPPLSLYDGRRAFWNAFVGFNHLMLPERIEQNPIFFRLEK